MEKKKVSGGGGYARKVVRGKWGMWVFSTMSGVGGGEKRKIGKKK